MRNLRAIWSIIQFPVLAASVLLAGCGGGGSGKQAHDNSDGSIHINAPTSLGRYQTFEERIDLSGSSAIPDGVDCTAAIVRNISGVNIRWRNNANNASGRGTSNLFCVGLVAATWQIRSIPLAIGRNQIRVSGTGGSDSVVVERLRDETAPLVTRVDPSPGSNNVNVNRTITASFNEAMGAGTINADSFLLRDSVANSIPANVRYSGLGRVAELIPRNPLNYLETYTATLTSDIADFRGGNRLTEDFIWQFTTGKSPDETAPEVVGVYPDPASTCVTVDTQVTATLSERPEASSINSDSFRLVANNEVRVAGALSIRDETISLAPDSNLVPGTTYQATVSDSVTDLARNPLTADFSWSFKVASDGTGSWSAMAQASAPTPRTGHVALWMDGEMFIWGGLTPSATNTGAIYEPATDSWRQITTAGAPIPRDQATAVWTGSENGSRVLVWGGVAGAGLATGRRAQR